MIAMFMFGSFTTQAFVAWYVCNLFVNLCGALAVIDHHRLQTKRATHARMWALIYKMEAAVDAKEEAWSFDNCPCQQGEMCSKCEEHLWQECPEQCGECWYCLQKEEQKWEASYDLNEYEAISLSHGKAYEDIMAERAYQAKMAKEADDSDLPF